MKINRISRVCSTSKLLLAPFLACVASCLTTQAAVLVGYDFNGSATNNETGSQYAPSTIAGGLTASHVTDLSGNLTISIGNGSSVGYADNFLLVNPEGVTTFTPTSYFGFSITPDENMELDLDSFTLDAARAGGSTRGFQVRSSADGFTNDLTVTPDSSSIGSQRPNYTSYSVDLSGLDFDSITSTLEFRIYPFGGTNIYIDYDNYVVNGTVSAIPEVSTCSLILGLASLGALLALRRRRNR